jgi:hypothetical protein
VAAAISYVGFDAADHPLDCEHYPHLPNVALAYTWASVGRASWLGNAAGIRMRSGGGGNSRFAPDHTIGRTTVLNGLVTMKNDALNSIMYPGALHRHLYTAFVQFTEEGRLCQIWADSQ